jgi:hypothetical protein
VPVVALAALALVALLLIALVLAVRSGGRQVDHVLEEVLGAEPVPPPTREQTEQTEQRRAA